MRYMAGLYRNHLTTTVAEIPQRGIDCCKGSLPGMTRHCNVSVLRSLTGIILQPIGNRLPSFNHGTDGGGLTVNGLIHPCVITFVIALNERPRPKLDTNFDTPRLRLAVYLVPVNKGLPPSKLAVLHTRITTA